MPVQDIFSGNYREAHEKFLRAANEIGAATQTFSMGFDLDSNPLFIGAAHFGPPGANKLVIIFSGVHGIEGYAGSAIQSQAFPSLKQLAEAENIRVLMVHAINPYGMALGQRWNADNVDLNRNANSNGLDNTTIDPIYVKLNSIINPPHPCGFEDFEEKIKTFAQQNNLDQRRIQSAIMGGQLQNPRGIFYKGLKLSAELAKIFEYIKEFDHDNLDCVSVLDIHTGIGDKGDSTLGTLFSLLSTDENEIAYREQLAKTYFCYQDNKYKHIIGDMPVLMGTTAAEIRVGGQFSGNLAYAVARCFKEAAVSSFVLELGTGPLLHELYTLINANSVLTFFPEDFKSMEDYQKSPIMQELREAFYPSDEEWRESVLKRGVNVCESLIKFSGAGSLIQPITR